MSVDALYFRVSTDRRTTQFEDLGPLPASLQGASLTSAQKAPTRAAIYARVSTSDQTCEIQLAALREYTRPPRLGERV